MSDRRNKIAAGYDRVAKAYAAHFAGELAHKPLDRALLDVFAAELRGKGKVVDLGCGPGQIARALHDRGVDVMGIDLSEEMIRAAREALPHIQFATGSMLDLDATDGAWAGIAAFYAIVHFDLPALSRALGEMRRVLAPGGLLLLAFHVGNEVVHVDELLGHRIDLDFVFFPREAVERALLAAGFTLEWSIERTPYVDFEHPTRRAYLLGRVPPEPKHD
jgi:ubiquinone/menaquinone biosynthesis C-methylase UbiE